MFKIVLFDFRILLMSIAMAIINVIMYARDETVSFMALLALALFIIVWFVWIAANLFIVFTTRIDTEKGEKRKLVELANGTKQGQEKNYNGLLVLTDRKLYFKSLVFARNKESLTYQLGDVRRVSIKYKGFFQGYQLQVYTRSRVAFLFDVFAGKRWKKAFQTQDIKLEYVKK